MKWKLPSIGDIRYVTCYAWLPTRVIDNNNNPYCVWFNKYVKRQEYTTGERWWTIQVLTIEAYEERVKFKQLFTDKTGIKYNADTVQDILNNLDYNSKVQYMTKHILDKLYKRRGNSNRKRKVNHERIRVNSDGTVTLFFGDRSITHGYYSYLNQLNPSKLLVIK